MKKLSPISFLLINIQLILSGIGNETIAEAKGFSIQEAIDRNPGRIVFVPEGEHLIDEPLKITQDRCGLYGPGVIIQQNANAPILIIDGADFVHIRDLVLMRAEGHEDTGSPGIKGDSSDYLTIENVQVLENHSPTGSIRLDRCNYSRILRCLVRNYMTITVDDRTGYPELYGFAFNSIDGSGMIITRAKGLLAQNNRIIETNIRPTPEIKEKYRLGDFVKKNPHKGEAVLQEYWDNEYFNGWHQGAGIQVTTPDSSEAIQISGNYIENAAQGMDIHADHAIIEGNIVINSFMGMKAMHGARNVLILGNQFIKNDLYSIGLMPGTASYSMNQVTNYSKGRETDQANVDGGSIIANNIISDFGYGDSYWIWKDTRRPAILLDEGPNAKYPPLRDVVITGNVIYDKGKEYVEGGQELSEPKYDYAVYIDTRDGAPENIYFSNNLFHPGRKGISNLDLAPKTTVFEGTVSSE